MSKRLTMTVTMVALAGVFATSVPRAEQLPAPRAEQRIPPKTPFDQLYKDYASGDFDVITRTLTSPRSLAVLQAPQDSGKLRKWLGKWDRAKAVFLLEFAGAQAQYAPGAAITALSEGRLFVISRPTPLGQSAEEDAFELAWHKGAMAMLEDRVFVTTQELYLDTLQRRYASVAGGPPTGGPGAKPPDQIRIDSRFALERGVSQEQRCWNDLSQATTTSASSAIAGLPTISSATSAAGNVTVQGSLPSADAPNLGATTPQPAPILTRKGCLAEGVRRFEIAAAAAETASEAFTRSAWLQYQIGALPDALRTIDRAVATDDAVLTYWTNLFRARILDGLERFADAERAYRAALAVRPAAQSAAVGLALTLFKLDRVTDARAAAMAARQQPPDTVDPWWTYLGADARFIPRWRAELRLALAQAPK
jgi:tetratricopeptide (TPR) repeat protein